VSTNNLTRIQNNQITDGAIQGGKIASGTLTGNLLASTVTFNSNITILGNLTVSNSYTQLNSINTYINDPIVVFNNGYTGSLTGYDIGILVNRNSATLAPYGSVNTFFGWIEADGAFEAIATTETGTSVSSINNSGYANVKIGNLTAVSGSFSGAVTALSVTTPTLNATNGNITTLYTANFNTANAVITGGSVNGAVIGNTTPAVGSFTTLNATTGFSTANAVISGGYISALSNATITTAVVTNFSSGNAVITGGSVNGSPIGASSASTGAFTTLTSSGVLTSNGNIVAASGTASTNTTTGALVVVGGLGVSGAEWIGSTLNVAGATTLQSTLGVTGATTLSTATAGSLQAQAIGNVTPGTATFTTETVGGLQAQAIGNVTPGTATFTTETVGGLQAQAIGNVTPGTGNFTTLQGTNFSTANAVITGGMTVNGNSTFGANLTVSGNAIIQGGLVVNGTFEYINSTITTHVDPVLELNTGVNGAPLAADNLADVGLKMHYYNGADRTSFIGRAYDSGFLEYYAVGTESGNTFTGTYGTVKSGALYLANTSTSTGFTPSTAGALYVAGGAGIAGDLYVAKTVNGGNGYFASINNTPIGNATPSTGAFTTLTAITSSPTNLNATFGNITTLYAQNFSSGNIQVTGGYLSGITNFNGTTGTLTNFASGNAVITGGSVNGSPIGASSASTGAFTTVTVSGTAIVSGNIVAGSGTASTNTTTGALVVTGGAGVSGNATIGGDTVITGNAYVQGGYIWTSATTFNLVNTTATTVNFAGAATTLNIGNASGITNVSGVVKATGNIVAASGTASTNSTTGALVVAGGVGVTGNVFLANAVTINSSQTAGQDFVVKGKNDSTLIWARPNATYDQVIIGNSATASTAIRGAKLIINTTDSLLIPAGTNAQRPGNSGGTDTSGMLRFNTTSNGMEIYNGTIWQSFSTSFTVIADQQFTGTGSQTAFTLSTAQTTASCIVSINGVLQIPTLAYAVSSTTLTFTEAPAATDIIDVRCLTTTSTVTSLASTNGYNSFSVDNYGANVYVGSSNTSLAVSWNASGAQVGFLPNTSVASANTATTIDTIDTTQYRSAKYVVQVTNNANYQVQEVLVISDGTTATSVTYGTLQTNGNLGVVQTTQSGTNTLVQFIATNATNNVRISKNYIVI